MYKDLKTLHPSGIRTRDLLFWRDDHYATPPGQIYETFTYVTPGNSFVLSATIGQLRKPVDPIFQTNNLIVSTS
jgi:hypothetical protein